MLDSGGQYYQHYSGLLANSLCYTIITKHTPKKWFILLIKKPGYRLNTRSNSIKIKLIVVAKTFPLKLFWRLNSDSLFAK